MRKSRLSIYTGISIVACCLGMWLYYLFSPVIYSDNGLIYYLRPGMSKRAFIADLHRQGILKYPLLFSFYVSPQKSNVLKTGEYFFPKGSSLVSIWHQVTHGKGLMYHPFTIVPGWSFLQLRHELLQTDGLRHLTAKLDDKQVMAFFGDSDLSPEGQFFPETYYYTKGVPDLVILKRAHDLMQSRLLAAWHTKASNLPYKNDYEALIAASMVEKEAFLDSERPIIAGVLVNRLKKNMLLQFDPTVIYGLGRRYSGKITKDNLIEDTPYNTYIHKGLPPTPIAMPSMSSLQAALHPQHNDYLYFVAKGDGSHQFSNTLLEHHVAVTEATATAGIKVQQPSFNEKFIQKYLHPHSEMIKKPSNSLITKP